MENEYLDEAKQYAVVNPCMEVCGLIIDCNGIKKFLKCENKSKDPRDSFTIHPLEYLKAKAYGDVLACFHSHIKDSSFSAQDIFNSFKHNLTYYLYNIKKDKFYIFDPKEKKDYKKYLHLTFNYGENDCFSLIRNFYKNELDIQMSDPAQDRAMKYIPPENCLIWNREKYKYWANENNLVDMDANNISQLKKYDILVFDGFNKGEPSHGMIYIGDELILHHPFNDVSKIESIRKAHFKFLKFIIRHEKF